MSELCTVSCRTQREAAGDGKKENVPVLFRRDSVGDFDRVASVDSAYS